MTTPTSVIAQNGNVIVESSGFSFSQPVAVRNAGDGTGRLFVVEVNTALIKTFTPGSSTQPVNFLDISDRVMNAAGEEGLLGLAFHPDYQNNGYFFVNYTATNPDRSVISRFSVSAGNANAADPNSEFVILEVGQPADNHNGGDLAFGPDGFLYIGFGDGGALQNGQDLTTLLSTMVRIDVNQTQGANNYSIPPTNPFVGNTDGYLEEIWAYGFRNPYRFSISAAGEVWVGDVGEDTYEEIDLVEVGKNYGWPIMEGPSCLNGATCDQTGLELPIHYYTRQDGYSVTGGYIYRGSISSLTGKYIFGDFGSQSLWALDLTGPTAVREDFTTAGEKVSCFGEDESGELYICSILDSVGEFVQELAIDTDTAGPVDGPSEAFTIDSAYPNPSDGHFVLPVTATRSASARIEAVDHLGRLVRTREVAIIEGSQEISFDLSDMAPGLYVLRCDLPGQTVSTVVSVAR